MKTLSLSEAKMKLSGLVEEVNAADEEIVITKNGSPAAVLIAPRSSKVSKRRLPCARTQPSWQKFGTV